MTFDPSKPAQTRDGRPARILATDLKSSWTIAAATTSASGEETFAAYYPNGSLVPSCPSDHDLINVDEFAKPGRDIVRNRRGDRVWLLTRDSPWTDAAPIVGIIENDSVPTHYRADGTWAACPSPHELDLILEP